MKQSDRELVDKYIGTAVEGFRRGNSSRAEIITHVLRLGNHCYDDCQHETAIYASTDGHPKPRWYVGYGTDYLPASKADITNIVW